MDIYTDGACSGNPGPGAYAFIIVGVEKDCYFQGFVKTTNNRMELLSVIEALELIILNRKWSKIINIYSDSKYVTDAINKGWLLSWESNNFKKRVNVDLWKRLLIVINKFDKTSLHFHWVEGHSDNKYNNKVDRLAQRSIKDGSAINIDEGYLDA